MKTPVSTTPSSPAPAEGGDRVPVPRKFWGWQGAALAFVTAFGALIFASIPSLAIGDDTPGATAAGSVVSSILTCIVFVGAPLLILSMLVGGLRRRDVGLVLPPKRLLWKIPAYAAIAFVAYILLSKGLGELIGAGDQEDDLPKKLGAEGSATAGIVIGIAVTVFAPIGEEFLLRGVVFPGIRDSLADHMTAPRAIGIAAVLDGLLFGALHLGGTKAIFVPILALFGVVLCLLYQATGSLYANILVHASNNSLAIAVSLKWSVLGGLALWAFAVTCITLLALAARAVEARLGPPKPRLGAIPVR